MVKKKSDKKEEKLKIRIREMEDNWKRAVADYQNFKKRYDKEKSDFVRYANQRFIEAFLPVYDALIVALDHADKNSGIEFIIKQIDDIFKNEKVYRIDISPGEDFDPNIMEAVETEKNSDSKNKNKVAGIIRTGFRYQERILRPTEVKVYN